jgi:hypothetical protein
MNAEDPETCLYVVVDFIDHLQAPSTLKEPALSPLLGWNSCRALWQEWYSNADP